MPPRKPKMESSPRHVMEEHANLHGEQKAAEMPVQTDHGAVTHENVGQNTSTEETRLNPSITGPLEDPTTDSMFNLADPQTRELAKGSASTDESHRGMNKKRASKNRKTA
jgi:hypothetical protein